MSIPNTDNHDQKKTLLCLIFDINQNKKITMAICVEQRVVRTPNGTICVVRCGKSDDPVFFTDGNKQDFFGWTGPATKALKPKTI